MNTEEIKSKMTELVKRWEGVPEAPKYSPEWFKRRGDRSYYIKLQSILKKSQRRDSNNLETENEKIAKQVGLIPY